MIESAKIVKDKAGWDKADVYIPHQANGRIIAGVRKRVSDEGAIVYDIIRNVGNMAGATCAVGVDMALKDGTIKRTNSPDVGSRTVIAAFGGGTSEAALAIQF